jgi:Raf kinase inhibitor-like YbhB/YbcL family protein
VALAAAGCGGGSGTDLERGPTAPGFAFSSASAVVEGQPVGGRVTCDWADVSPALAWEGVPAGTSELALVVEDPDAPGATFTHWLVFGLQPSSTGLGEGAVPAGQGNNDFGDARYGGPCPPGGEEHRYVFRLPALDSPCTLEHGADRAAFDAGAGPLVLAEARLTATYERS